MEPEATTEATSQADPALIQRYLSGDGTAAAVLVDRYERPLSAYILRRLGGDRDLAEECVQEVFCRLLERAEALQRHPRIEAWLFAVARNVTADVCRLRRVRAAPFSVLGGANGEAAIEGDAAARPERRLQSSELSRLVLQVVGEMPPLEREVFLLRTQSGLPFREIAARQGAPLNTVLSRMHRALKRIRRSLARRGWVRDDGGREKGGRDPW
ncbi:MAG: sigma-70 family RNA polymerase sigma factor [Planctomycetes bacterium]|nr:sigma-70 family RNA polymerase sigma factor [Planctomycetota bacterium]